jgi:hypothetical protein
LNGKLSAEELREIFLSTQESDATRLMAVIMSILLVTIVLILVRRRSLQEEYTPIWIAVAVMLVILTVRIELLHGLTRMIGAWTTASTLFFLGEFFLVGICLNYAVRLSRTSVRLKNLAQEMTLIRAEVEQLHERLDA